MKTEGTKRLPPRARSFEQTTLHRLLVRCLLLALTFIAGCAHMYAVERLRHP